MSIWSVAMARMRSLVTRSPAPGGAAPARQLPARGDAWVNSYTGLGTSTYDGSAQTYATRERPHVVFDKADPNSTTPVGVSRTSEFASVQRCSSSALF